MTVYLVQHGRPVAKEVDPDRPLSPEGVAEVEKTARFLHGSGVRPERRNSGPGDAFGGGWNPGHLYDGCGCRDSLLNLATYGTAAGPPANPAKGGIIPPRCFGSESVWRRVR